MRTAATTPSQLAWSLKVSLVLHYGPLTCVKHKHAPVSGREAGVWTMAAPWQCGSLQMSQHRVAKEVLTLPHLA